MDERWRQLADILVNYSARVEPGERVMIAMKETTTLPLARAVHEAAIKAGALVQVQFQSDYLWHAEMRHGSPEQVAWVPKIEAYGFDATFGSLVRGLEPREGSTLFRILRAVTERVMGSPVEKLEVPDLSIEWMMGNLLGGSPDEVPEVYELASPITHAGPDSPPTLFLQGEHDCFQPAHLSRALHHKLVEAGVPSVYVEFPQTEHGFDLLLPRYAPAAQAALYDVERFLALMV